MIKIANGSLIVNNGKTIIIQRAYNSAATQTVPSVFSVGTSNGTPNVTDTALDVRVPISNGTVNDNGSNSLAGSNGGNATTDNTTTYKQGAGESDAQSQNLLTNGTSATKTWTLTPLTANFSGTQPFAFWLYIKDAAAYAKFLAAGTALQLRIRTSGDAANLSYLYNRTKAQLATGWNFITSGTTNVNALTQGAGGAPSGALNEFIIEITTTAAADAFVAGDVLYDLMRQWAASDLIKTFVTGYPTIDTTNHEAQIRAQLLSTEANGFDLTGFALYNTDGTPLMHSEDTYSSESKSDTDQFTFLVTDRLV